MKTERVSIVVATYNYARFLPTALHSICAQTYTNWEAIVVDDGSTDNTAEIVKPYLEDPRFRYVRTENRGQPAAKNRGIREACGELVAFLDGDDVWLSEKLERQVDLFRTDPAVGVVYCERRTIGPTGERLDGYQSALHRGNVLQWMFKDNFVCFSSSMARRAVLEEAGLFDEHIPLAIDYDLWLRVAVKHRFDYVDQPLVLYRTGHANLSCREEERLRIALRIMDRFLNERGGRKLLPRRVVRRAYAETYAHIGRAVARRTRLRAAAWFLRALAADPLAIEAWHTILHTTVPAWMKRLLRAVLTLDRRPRQDLTPETDN